MVGRPRDSASRAPSRRQRTRAVPAGRRPEVGLSAVTAPVAGGAFQTVRDYVSLLKLRIVLLLDATAVGVMIPAAHGHPGLMPVFSVIVGGTLAAGGAHAINCWFDPAIDAGMRRTRSRPVPGGPSPPWHALALANCPQPTTVAV